MLSRKFCLELPVHGTEQYYRVCETVNAENMAEVVRALLKATGDEPITIRICTVPIEVQHTPQR